MNEKGDILAWTDGPSTNQWVVCNLCSNQIEDEFHYLLEICNMLSSTQKDLFERK